jgi:hypothetical protein
VNERAKMVDALISKFLNHVECFTINALYLELFKTALKIFEDTTQSLPSCHPLPQKPSKLTHLPALVTIISVPMMWNWSHRSLASRWRETLARRG